MITVKRLLKSCATPRQLAPPRCAASGAVVLEALPLGHVADHDFMLATYGTGW